MVISIKTKKGLIWKSGLVFLFVGFFLWLLYRPSSTFILSDSNDKKQTKSCSSTKDGQVSIEYAVMIDAGSSGSRVHVYRFSVCDEPVLENEVFQMLNPGLSHYENNPQEAAASLTELLDIAVQSVPEEKQKCTPIAVKATAGLRLLGAEKSEAILNAVRKLLESYPFFIAGDNAIEIMDGKDEGVYAWITVNYLLGKLKNDGQSAAIFDLGGASTQIVFEPTFVNSGQLAEGDHRYQLEYQNGVFDLYQHSYLGYGLNEARKKIKTQMINMWKGKDQVYHPCLPDGYKEQFEYEKEIVTLIGTGAGHAACRNIIEKVFNKDKLCQASSCAFDGVYQPLLTETFRNRDLYVFSYFYDLTQPLGMPSEFSVEELGELADRVCKGETRPFEHIPEALKHLADDPDYCLNLSYIYNLLRFGYDIPSDRLVRTAKKIRGAETGWCLGASIAMLDQVDLCKA